MSITKALGRVGIVLLVTVMVVCGGGSGDGGNGKAESGSDKAEVGSNKAKGNSVKIGDLTWTRQNINVETVDSWCYELDDSNCAKYGRLYTWEAAKEACASMGGGWRLPTNEDWDKLINSAGGKNVAGKKLKSKSGWIRCGVGGGNCVDDGNGTDGFGFSAMPGGISTSGSVFYRISYEGVWWSAVAHGTDYANIFAMSYHNDNVHMNYYGRHYGLSVRCVGGSDDGGNSNAEGGSSKTKGSSVKIGDLTWTRKNINIETPNSWCFDSASNCVRYGRLYTWEAAKEACASMGGGWRLPTNEDWDNLVNYAGGKDVASKKLKAKGGWNDYKFASSNGTDDYGFSALPGGYRKSGGSIYDTGNKGSWWSSTENGNYSAYGRHMSYSSDRMDDYGGSKTDVAYAVRCTHD